MKKILLLLLVFSLIVTACTTEPIASEEPDPVESDEPTPPPEEEPEEPSTGQANSYPALLSQPLTMDEAFEYVNDQPLSDELIQAIREFSFNTSQSLLSGEDNDNYSPLSLYIALSMAASGAENDTAAELYQALGREVDPAALAEEIASIMERLNIETAEGRIRLANSVWNQFDFPFKTDYIDRLTDQFQAALFEVDFNDPSTGDRMSEWASEATEGLIKPSFDNTEDFISVLFNALYFKESWLTPFEASQTQTDLFRGLEGEVDKDFLHSLKRNTYIKHDGVEGVILPFEVNQMVILKKSGANPIDILADYDMSELLGSTQSALIDLRLPKFTYENDYKLNDLLKELGIEQAFDPDQADFSGMSDQDLFISAVKQNSYIALDETGVEAAAVTSIVAETTSIPTETVELSFDEPFLYIIQSPEGLPLFIGTLTH